MNFVSLTFLSFLAITFIVYHIFPLRFRWVVLLGASLYFYAQTGPKRLVIILITALVAYGTALQIESIYDAETGDAQQQKKKARFFCTAAVLFFVAALVYAKAGRQILDALGAVFGGKGIDLPLLVPMGISYYTFSLIGYVSDVYRKKEKAEKNFLHLLLYMIYFPQMIEGPIPRHSRLQTQLTEGHKFDYDRLCFGLQRMMYGYFKKMVLADRAAVLVNTIYGSIESYEGGIFFVAIFASVIQFYTDFSGCMDMVLGMSECFGIVLDENFRRPFFARSAAEFWRRWHITLGAWFKDYVYMPLLTSPTLAAFGKKVKSSFGKNAGKNVMTVVPLAVVWFLTGLWHGTGMDFIVWGFYWGIIIITSTILSKKYKSLTARLKIDTDSRLWTGWQKVRTTLIFCFAQLLIGPGGLDRVSLVIQRLFSRFTPWILFDGSLYELGLNRQNFWCMIYGVILLFLISVLQERGIRMRERIAKLPLLLRWMIWILLLFSIFILGMYGPEYNAANFIYENF